MNLLLKQVNKKKEFRGKRDTIKELEGEDEYDEEDDSSDDYY